MEDADGALESWRMEDLLARSQVSRRGAVSRVLSCSGASSECSEACSSRQDKALDVIALEERRSLMSLIGIFVASPWLALLPTLTFAALGHRRHRAAAWVAAAAWLLYAAYETAMARRILCSGDCNIRVDLLLVYPILLMLSVAAAISAIRPRHAAV